MVQSPEEGNGKTPLSLPAFKVPTDEMPRGSRLQVRATLQNINSVATLLGTAVQSNASQYNSSAINPTFYRVDNVQFLVTLSEMRKVMFMTEVLVKCGVVFDYIMLRGVSNFLSSREGGENISDSSGCSAVQH